MMGLQVYPATLQYHPKCPDLQLRYRVKWYNETEEVAKSMCPVESAVDPFNLG